MMMHKNVEGIIAVGASILVLFAAAIDPKISMIIAILAFAGLAYYNFTKR